MRGLSHFSTKQDVMTNLQMFPVQAKQKLQELYNDRYTWVNTGDLEKREDGVEDETHIICEDNSTDSTPKYYQMEKQIDPNAMIYRFGFTDNEILELLK